MVTQFKIFEMLDKKTKIKLFRFNDIYSGKVITIKVRSFINRKLVLKDEQFTIDKIFYQEPDIFNKMNRAGSLIISLKGKFKRSLEITKDAVILHNEFENPMYISHYDDTIDSIVYIYRNL